MKVIWKILKYLVITGLSVLLLSLLIVLTFSFYRPTIPKTDAAIVLGAAINTPTLYNRTLEGLKMYEQGKTGVLVLSGGRISDQDISEAGYMQKVIKKNQDENVPVHFRRSVARYLSKH